MSFTDRKNTILIGTGSLLTGTLTKVTEEPTLNNDGWDSLIVTYYQRRVTCSAEDLAALFPLGARLGSRSWWITGARPQQVAPGFWKFLVDLKGWAAEKPAVIRVGASANQQSGESVRAPDFPGDTVGSVYAKVETQENTPDLLVSYLTENILSGGQTANVGQAVTPPVTIPVPTSVWVTLETYVYHWPNGWVLMASNQDRLPGTNAAYVQDAYKYIHEKSPG